MKSQKINFLIFFFLTAITVADAQEKPVKNNKLFTQNDLKLISANFSFTEGPSVNKKGDVFFTDQPDDKIWKYTTTGELSIFLSKSGRANGTYFDKNGNLMVCADEKGEIWSIDPTGKTKVIVKDLYGIQLNGPNDLWLDRKGGIYFTDPYYQRSYWKRTAPDLATESVYFLPKGTNVIKLAADSLQRPNGIVGTPDGKYLYVSDASAGKTYRYNISVNGELTSKRLFIDKGSDGMTLDRNGNIYLTGDGVAIYSSEGKAIGHIVVPGGTTNLCFAGKKRNILFITARKSIYTIPMKVKGVE
jgi:gluconolactonase